MANVTTLKDELLELSKKVDDYLLVSNTSDITFNIELGEEQNLPLLFECDVIAPGFYRGLYLSEEELAKACPTFFMEYDNYSNSEINKQHKSARKKSSTIDDLLGKVTECFYDYDRQVVVARGEVHDARTASFIIKQLVKFVSVALSPHRVEYLNGVKHGKEIEYQELSFVRNPGYAGAKVTRISQ